MASTASRKWLCLRTVCGQSPLLLRFHWRLRWRPLTRPMLTGREYLARRKTSRLVRDASLHLQLTRLVKQRPWCLLLSSAPRCRSCHRRPGSRPHLCRPPPGKFPRRRSSVSAATSPPTPTNAQSQARPTAAGTTRSAIVPAIVAASIGSATASARSCSNQGLRSPEQTCRCFRSPPSWLWLHASVLQPLDALLELPLYSDHVGIDR